MTRSERETLTPAERAVVIEKSLDCFANRFVERLARSAPNVELATAVVRERLMGGGSWSGTTHIVWDGRGVHVSVLANGHQGTVRYREIAESARQVTPAPVQLAFSLEV